FPSLTVDLVHDDHAQGERYGTAERTSFPGDAEDAPDRVAAGVGTRTATAPREGEGTDACTRCAGRRASADAVAGSGEAVRVRGAQRQGEPRRPVRRP